MPLKVGEKTIKELSLNAYFWLPDNRKGTYNRKKKTKESVLVTKWAIYILHIIFKI